jgi:hypothetical protein
MALRQRRPRGVRTTRRNRAFKFTIERVRQLEGGRWRTWPD